jgi:hypothetical protein
MANLPPFRQVSHEQELVAPMEADKTGPAALNELHCFFDAVCRAWRQEQVNMIGQDREFVQTGSGLLAIVAKRLYQNFGNIGKMKYRSSLPTLRRYKVQIVRRCSVLQC